MARSLQAGGTIAPRVRRGAAGNGRGGGARQLKQA
jgi:hypothetical protein